MNDDTVLLAFRCSREFAVEIGEFIADRQSDDRHVVDVTAALLTVLSAGRLSAFRSQIEAITDKYSTLN